jgi:DNA repair protein RadC
MSLSMELLSSRMAAEYLRKLMGKASTEELWVIALNPKCGVIETSMLFRGTIDACFVHPRDIFRFALLNNASSLIVAHNHPSNDCNPSEADNELTKRLKVTADLLQIPIVDHLIVTERDHFSFAESQRWGRKVSRRSLLSDRFRRLGRDD